MKLLSKLSAVLLSLYLHGLTFYFCITGFSAGLQSSALTAAYQLTLVGIPLVIALFVKDCREKLLRLEPIDLLYLLFVILFLYDLREGRFAAEFPENLVIYFSLYWTSLAVARSLTLKQFKLVCQVSNLITILTSSIILAQVITGTANWADHGRRLVAGASNNPIILGYTGAYAFLTSLILAMRAKYPWNLVWLVVSLPGLSVCLSTGTRSALLSIFLGGAFVAIYSLKVLARSNKSLSRVVLNGFIVVTLVFSFSLASESFVPAARGGGPSEKASPITVALESGLERVSSFTQILTGGGSQDRSTQQREVLYQTAWEGFMQNPMTGNGLYSAHAAHNAFLQVSTEFGLLGVVTFVVPFIYIFYRMIQVIFIMKPDVRRVIKSFPTPEQFLNSDYATISSFCIVIFAQAVCMFSFHGDPYRSFLPITSIGVLIAYLRLGKRAIQNSRWDAS
ncbi:O-antigen ligase family protein [Phormidesmis sp. 146-35]